MTPIWTTVSCPYCGESFETAIDGGDVEPSTYTEDCAVCCRPIVFHVHFDDDGTLNVTTRREDE